MHVFIALCDIESSTGGGQTVYRQIFRHYPRVQFTYLLDVESEHHPRPANVSAIRLAPWYVRNSDQSSFMMNCYCWAKTIANTLKGRHFDVVEIPDFMTDYCLLPAALLANDPTTRYV